MRRSPRPVSVRMRSMRSGSRRRCGSAVISSSRIISSRSTSRRRRRRHQSRSPRRPARDPARRMRSVPSRVTSARERTTRSPGSRMPNCREVGRGPAGPKGSTVPVARTCSAMSRASARSRRSGETASPTSATRSMPSRSRLDVATQQRGEDVDDGRLLDRVEPTDRAEVDQPEACRPRTRRCCRGAGRRGRSPSRST